MQATARRLSVVYSKSTPRRRLIRGVSIRNNSMIRVCPNPPIWVDVYQSLDCEWKLRGRIDEPPPIPLVLAGWIYSSDRDKQVRWNLTVDWANRHKMEHLIPELDENQYYQTDFLTTSYPQQNQGPQVHPRAERPSHQAIEHALAHLQKNWTSVAGSVLSELTSPLEFTGDKARRLLVAVIKEGNPPWGHWESFSIDGDKQSFSAFRRRINDAIEPLHVDHVDFSYKKYC